MASLFSKPPSPPSPPKVPTDSSPAVQKAKGAQRMAMQGSGRSGNVLTSPTGTATPAPVQYKTLLGA